VFLTFADFDGRSTSPCFFPRSSPRFETGKRVCLSEDAGTLTKNPEQCSEVVSAREAAAENKAARELIARIRSTTDEAHLADLVTELKQAVEHHVCTSTNAARRDGRCGRTYTIFEGTSEIQRLVIAQAISGVHMI
jgi:hypothetical protein